MYCTNCTVLQDRHKRTISELSKLYGFTQAQLTAQLKLCYIIKAKLEAYCII